jgi:hypothetical protein
LKKQFIFVLFAILIGLTGFNQIAQADVIDFEGLEDFTAITDQYSSSGIYFSGATVLTAGVNLNEFEFPPSSGSNVVFDEIGPISIIFATPVSSIGAYFTYLMPVAMDAYDSSNGLIGSVSSSFFSNLALSGDPGSSPNEFLQITYAGGISSVTITGDPDFGGSFTMDDVTFSQVPEPGTLSLFMVGILTVIVTHRRLSR